MVHMRYITLRPSRSRGVATASVAVALLVSGCTGYHADSSGMAPAPLQPPAGRETTDRPDGFNAEVLTDEQPTSTFAIDVDPASYNYARRRILDGSRPLPDEVRPEEFVNAFRQDYRQPAGDGFTVALDGTRMPPQHRTTADGPVRILRIGLQTRDDDRTDRSDAALTFVIDVSGSMAEPGRLDLVQDALHTLVDQLRETDSVAIVAYETEAHVLREMTPARNRQSLHAAVDDLASGGSTNLEAGLVTGYRVARDGFVTGASNRVILLSDGLANVGNTDAEPILRQIREEAAKEITLLGVGVGSQYGDALMERLADEGDGFVTYVSEREQARTLFVDRLPAALTVRALDAKVQVTFDPSTVVGYRLVGYDNRVLANEDFRDDRVDGGEVGPGHSVTALYVVRLREGGRGDVATARVRWLDPTSREASETAAVVTVADLDRGFAAAALGLRVSYVAAFFAEILRRSPYAGDVELGDLAGIADAVARQTDDSNVAELADLIRRTE